MAASDRSPPKISNMLDANGSHQRWEHRHQIAYTLTLSTAQLGLDGKKWQWAVVICSKLKDFQANSEQEAILKLRTET